MQRVSTVNKLVESPACDHLRSILGTRDLGQRPGLFLRDIVGRENGIDEQVRDKVEAEIDILLQDSGRSDDALE